MPEIATLTRCLTLSNLACRTTDIEALLVTDVRIAKFSPNLAPNVKDEPRPRPARLLRHYVDESALSFDWSFNSRRRDGRGRWLWRLVGKYGTTALTRLRRRTEMRRD